MFPAKRLQNNLSDDSGKPVTPTQSQADDSRDPGDDIFDHPPKEVVTKNFDSGNGDPGISLSHDNNILSPALSTGWGGQFSDNSISPFNRSPTFSGRPQTTSDISKSTMNVSDGQKGPPNTPLHPGDFSNNNNNSGRNNINEDNTIDNNLQKQLIWMQKNLNMLKHENAALESALASSGTKAGMWSIDPMDPHQRVSRSPAFLLTSFKLEMATFKAELAKVNSYLESCELGRRSFAEKWSNNLALSFKQLNELLTELLYKNLENPIERILMSALQSRLKLTEERLRQNRKELTGDLSKSEENLLLENVQCKMSLADMNRKFQQSNVQVQAMKRKHQGLIEICQKLKVRSSENGFIDVQEILKRLAVDDIDSKLCSQVKEESLVSRDLLQEMKEENSKQMSALVNEKQLINSELSSINDENVLMRLENERLKKSLNEFNTTWEMEMREFKRIQNANIQRLLQQMEVFASETEKLCRCDVGSSSALKVLEDVLVTKERLLTSSLAELDRLRDVVQSNSKDEEKSSKSKQKSEQLAAVFQFMKLKFGDAPSSSRLSSQQEQQEPISVTSPSLEGWSQLRIQCSKLENDLEFAEKNLEFQKLQVDKLQSQVNTYQDELRQKSRALELSTSNEIDLRRELRTHKEWIDNLNAQLLDKDKEMKLMELDKGSVQRLLEKDKVNLEASDGGNADIKFMKQALELDLIASRNALDNNLKENLLLKQSLNQAARELAAERDITSSATYDKMLLQQQLYIGQQERDDALRMRDKLTTENALLQIENQKLASFVSKDKSPESDKELQERMKSVSTELSDVKMKLEAKEKDVAFLQDTLKFVLKSNEASV